jgi:uncharacterized protein YbgA (DUF1722 family)/uncharacterized protein YbbK (DUF523 family)
LGEPVRYDGGHKHDLYITETLGHFFEFVPVCPEVAIGLGVPRPPIHLVGNPQSPRAVGVHDPTFDVTDRLSAYGKHQARKLTGLSGYIFKSQSPSCGLAGVPVYGGARGRSGRGRYAAALLAQLPLLPVEEEDGLGDPRRRENFIECVFAYHRWQELERQGLTAARLADFHAAHEFALMAHDGAAYRRLGRLVAKTGRGLQPLAHEYIGAFMQAFRRPATRARHAVVLRHLTGYLKKHLDTGDKAELLESIDQYRLGQTPRIVPVTLLRHYFRRFPDSYVRRQTYLAPQLAELMLHP